MSSNAKVTQTMVYRMKTTIEDAQVNLTTERSRAEAEDDNTRCDEKSKVGNHMILSTDIIHMT